LAGEKWTSKWERAALLGWRKVDCYVVGEGCAARREGGGLLEKMKKFFLNSRIQFRFFGETKNLTEFKAANLLTPK
jgi:hypothetical protein